MTDQDGVKPSAPIGTTGQRCQLYSLVVKDAAAFQQCLICVLQVAAILVEREDRVASVQHDDGRAGPAVLLPGKTPAIVPPEPLTHDDRSDKTVLPPRNEGGKETNGMTARDVIPVGLEVARLTGTLAYTSS